MLIMWPSVGRFAWGHGRPPVVRVHGRIVELISKQRTAGDWMHNHESMRLATLWMLAGVLLVAACSSGTRHVGEGERVSTTRTTDSSMATGSMTLTATTSVIRPSDQNCGKWPDYYDSPAVRWKVDNGECVAIGCPWSWPTTLPGEVGTWDATGKCRSEITTRNSIRCYLSSQPGCSKYGDSSCRVPPDLPPDQLMGRDDEGRCEPTSFG